VTKYLCILVFYPEDNNNGGFRSHSAGNSALLNGHVLRKSAHPWAQWSRCWKTKARTSSTHFCQFF